MSIGENGMVTVTEPMTGIFSVLVSRSHRSTLDAGTSGMTLTRLELLDLIAHAHHALYPTLSPGFADSHGSPVEGGDDGVL